MRDPYRITPKLPAQSMKTYQIIAPATTHWRPATCEEVGCLNHRFGWQTVVDESIDLGQRQAHYIRNQSGRRYTEDRDAPGLTTFVFEAGQKCFAPHQVRLDRPDIFLVKDGDFRGSTNPRQHVGPADWVDDFANHQQKLADEIEKG